MQYIYYMCFLVMRFFSHEYLHIQLDQLGYFKAQLIIAYMLKVLNYTIPGFQVLQHYDQFFYI